MTLLVISMVAALTNPLALLHRPSSRDLQSSVTVVQNWRIELRHDTFANRSSCRLRRGPMTLERGVMTFQFPHSVETATAEYRLDGGPVQSAGATALEVAGQGVRLGTGDLRHPGDGRVTLPLRLIRTAHAVDIRPNLRRSHRAFDLAGLSAALDAAQREGCDAQADRAPSA